MIHRELHVEPHPATRAEAIPKVRGAQSHWPREQAYDASSALSDAVAELEQLYERSRELTTAVGRSLDTLRAAQRHGGPARR